MVDASMLPENPPRTRRTTLSMAVAIAILGGWLCLALAAPLVAP
jgi:hypothetical protein